jgi:putative addiction module component (TIGR02574 family)
MTTYSEILSAALGLPPLQRSELVETLLDSVPQEEDAAAPPELSEAWKREIARRSAEIDAGTAKYVTYEQMRERARLAAGHND